MAPLWDPYLNIEEAVTREVTTELMLLGSERIEHVSRFLSVLRPRREESWEDVSYTVWPLVLIAARRLMRQDLERLWYDITKLEFAEFLADDPTNALLWHCKAGTHQGFMVRRPTSWQWLLAEARKTGTIPGALALHRHWLPYYLLVFPHRFTVSSVLALDDAIAGRL